jgi:hypothetical protein
VKFKPPVDILVERPLFSLAELYLSVACKATIPNTEGIPTTRTSPVHKSDSVKETIKFVHLLKANEQYESSQLITLKRTTFRIAKINPGIRDCTSVMSCLIV